jgi:hypothetical protein
VLKKLAYTMAMWRNYMEEYITNSEFEILLEDIQDKLDHQKIEECRAMLTQIIDDGKKQNRYIDRTYIGEIKARKRINRISEINDMLLKMTNTQIENVHRYTVDEYDEPNHEAEALNAIMSLSRKE